MTQIPPQRIDASLQTSNPATIIFLHGYGDDADGWTNIAQQFHSASKLPYLSWIFPNAPYNHEAMTNSWYTPTAFAPIPVGRSSGDAVKEEDEGFDEESEEELLQSVEYVCGLIDGEVKNGVKVERIAVGGFSQGCAVSLVTALASRYQGKLAGVVGLSGYLPRGKGIREGRSRYVTRGEEGMKVFLAHGTKDMLVPMRVFRDTKARVESMVDEKVVEARVYEGMGHVTSGRELRDMCAFLERVIPE